MAFTVDEEIEFWAKQMSEHCLFIELGLVKKYLEGAEKLVYGQKIKSIIHPKLVSHVVREAERVTSILKYKLMVKE